MFMARATKTAQYGAQVWTSKKLGIRVQQEFAVYPRIMSVTGTLKEDSRRHQFVNALAPIEAASLEVTAEFHDLIVTTSLRAK